ncbi:acyl carrier protein [Roseisolibacter sp. H3M3-2]|uniref:acyl carrier protein n=1 Tax=Roseisolibacter sp. H3M3-2 TaxID=3031323 RepID=UPI0023DC7A76|nr:acyl carrier protein [Roseisolibacter sp. H3M3-2]MDF1502864.1 acyl carrier protein [Roseisolibacter sp. H3M3-2]
MENVDKIVGIITRAGELETLAPDQDFYHAGVDSMKAMDIMLDLETEFDVTVPDEQFIQARTAVQLGEMIERLRAG